MSEVQLPFRAEYAKSGRASCRACRVTIEKGALRMAVMVQSPFFDGFSPNWYHFTCFFKKQRVKGVGDIAHYDSLRWEDQEKIKANIEANAGGNGPPAAPTAKGRKRGAAAGKSKVVAPSTVVKGPQEFRVEYAKSGRSTCQGCEEMIVKDEVRCSKKDFDSEEGRRFGGMDRWYHLACFAKLRLDLGWYDAGSQLSGFKQLEAEDKAVVKKQLPKVAVKAEKAEDQVDAGEPPMKKVKTAEDEAREGRLREQNKAMFKYRDLLTGSNVKRADMAEMLEENEQFVPSGEEKLRDALTDVLVFGALVPCRQCKGGQLVFRSGIGYQCQGDLTEWVKCNLVDVNPKRRKFIVPDDMKLKYPFLAKYKGKVGKREIEVKVSSTALVKAATEVTKVEPDQQPKIYHPPPPLKNMQVLVMGDVKTDKDELKAKILSLGGRWAYSLKPEVAFVISTPADVLGMNKRMEKVKALDIQVLPEEMLDEITNFTPDDVYLYIKKKSICDWGSDPKARVPQPEPTKSMSKSVTKSIYTKSVPSHMKVQLKGGAYVDPESGLEHMTHVYKDRSGSLYTAVLNLTDIQNNRNSYYKLQLLESDKGKGYWLFRQWGRIGTTIGGSKVEKMDGLQAGKDRFHELYLEKSGNEWSQRNNFVKRPGLMYPVDVDYGQDAPMLKSLESKLTSRLQPQIQDLLRMLFDVEAMQRTMMEFELDLEKMPLGKVSSKQVRQGYAILTQLQEAVVANASRAIFLDLSNKFYTLIPHSFGVDAVPIINTEEQIKQKLDMLENMMEVEIGYKLLSAPVPEGEHPLDAHYKQLKADIMVVDKNTEEFSMLQRYVRNTHAPTHTQYDLEIEEVFKVQRQEEVKRYQPYRKRLENKQLLWHGSRVTNFAGILSQGLRIAPKEAPVTGYMFGKGIYFADMVSKSANYCCTSKANPTGLMLLCEVALGKVCEKTQAEALAKPPPGYHSVKGVGMTEPDPSEVHVTPEGVVVPLGPVRTTTKKSSLLYNEYIVYETSQLQMQYLFKMKFNHKY